MSVPMVRSPSGSVMLNFYRVVGVAQLVERRSVAPNVAGSIPVSHPKPSNLKTKHFRIFPFSLRPIVVAHLLHTAFRGPPGPLRTGREEAGVLIFGDD